MPPAPRATFDIEGVDRALRQILEPYRSRLHVTKDGPAGLALEIPGLEGRPWGYVAGVRPGKRYVSYYLMSLYAALDAVASMSPELRRRMQGKACFNFTTVDPELFAELAVITEAGFEPHLDVARTADVQGPAAQNREARLNQVGRGTMRDTTTNGSANDNMARSARRGGGSTWPR